MKKIFFVFIIGMFLFSLGSGFVSAEKIWTFNNYTLNISDNIYFGGNIFGDGSGLTNLNVSALNLSDYIPYTGSSKNVVLGDYNFSVGTSDFFVNSNGNVGIGTTTPTSLLEIKGTTDAIFTLNSATDRDAQITFKENSINKWYLYNDGSAGDILNLGKSTGETVLTVNQDGNVGIGTATPGGKLEVVGNTILDMYVKLRDYDDDTLNTELISRDSSWMFWNGGIVAGQYANGAVPSGFGGTGTLLTMGQTALAVSSGKVGIGTTAPNEKLDVNGAIQIRGTTAGYGTTQSVGMVDFYNAGERFLSFGADASTKGIFSWYQAGQNNANGAEVMRISNTGNVGIGTTSPGAKLEVNGTIQSKIADGGSAFIVQNLTGVNRFAFNTLSGGGLRIYDYGGGAWNSGISQINGNVGIGTTGPSEKLDVISRAILLGSDHASVTTRTTATAKSGRIGMVSYTTTEEPINLISGYATSDSSAEVNIGGGTSIYNAATALKFYTAANAITLTGTERMRISSTGGLSFGNTYVNTNPGDGNVIIAGNVGIGTTTPNAKLEVTGDVIIDLSD